MLAYSGVSYVERFGLENRNTSFAADFSLKQLSNMKHVMIVVICMSPSVLDSDNETNWIAYESEKHSRILG